MKQVGGQHMFQSVFWEQGKKKGPEESASFDFPPPLT